MHLELLNLKRMIDQSIIPNIRYNCIVDFLKKLWVQIEEVINI